VEGLAPSLVLHADVRVLHGGDHRFHLDSSAVPGVAQAWTCLSAGHPVHSAEISHPADRAGYRSRPALAALWRVEQALVSLVSGPLFVLTLVAAEWPFASFLTTDAAKNRFFGAGYLDYSTPSWSLDATRHFFRPQHGLALWTGLAEAMLFAAISVWLGLLLGDWMRKVQR
jgi:hypothetical protein